MSMTQRADIVLIIQIILLVPIIRNLFEVLGKLSIHRWILECPTTSLVFNQLKGK